MPQTLHTWTRAHENFSRPVLGGLGLTYHTNSAAWSDIEFIVLMGCVLKDATSFYELACVHASERTDSNLAHVNTCSHNLQQACTRRSTVEHQSLCQRITNGLERTSRECLLARPPWNKVDRGPSTSSVAEVQSLVASLGFNQLSSAYLREIADACMLAQIAWNPQQAYLPHYPCSPRCQRPQNRCFVRAWTGYMGVMQGPRCLADVPPPVVCSVMGKSSGSMGVPACKVAWLSRDMRASALSALAALPAAFARLPPFDNYCGAANLFRNFVRHYSPHR